MFSVVWVRLSVSLLASVLLTVGLSACGGGGGGSDNSSDNSLNNATPTPAVTAAASVTPSVTPTPTPISGLTSEETTLLLSQGADQLRAVTVKDTTDPMVQLGMRLFFSKSLGGTGEVACASCHHPAVGGGDALPMSVGIGAVDQNVVGVGRATATHNPKVPRNALTVFNMALWDQGLFWDSRVESLGKEVGANGSGLSGISTFESAFGVADPDAGKNLPSAQVRAPVVGTDEMKGNNSALGSTPTEIRQHLAERIGDYASGIGELNPNNWLPLFQAAFNSNASPPTLITFENIAFALGEYERSMNFVNNPWREFLQSKGSVNKLSKDQLKGAVLFFKNADQGGAGCVSCHRGPLLSDEQHHVLGYPSIGPGPAVDNGDDFGREDATGDAADRYAFRTPSLLNVALTQPYGHSGAYATLNQVINHYRNPRQTVSSFFDGGGLCQLPAFTALANCASLFLNNRANTLLAVDKLQQQQAAGVSQFKSITLSNAQAAQVLEFLQALTDPCLLDRACFGKWIPSASNPPDNNQLNAIDQNGTDL